MYEGMIKDERFVQEQYTNIRNSLLGEKSTSSRVRSRSEEKSEDTRRGPGKKARSADGRNRRRRSPTRQRDGGKKGRKSPRRR